jgi:hypothetical protein
MLGLEHVVAVTIPRKFFEIKLSSIKVQLYRALAFYLFPLRFGGEPWLPLSGDLPDG